MLVLTTELKRSKWNCTKMHKETIKQTRWPYIHKTTKYHILNLNQQALLWYTIPHWAVLIIFPLILQIITVTTAQTMSIGGQWKTTMIKLSNHTNCILRSNIKQKHLNTTNLIHCSNWLCCHFSYASFLCRLVTMLQWYLIIAQQ